MKGNKKTYWKGLEQLSNDPAFEKKSHNEFSEYLPLNDELEKEGSSRRDFLKMMGFGIAAASLAACEAPVRKAIPYVNKPVDVDPGMSNYYASTYVLGGDYCSVVVKTREGRPIKIEGNKLSKITQGGVSAQVEASVLSLYDNERLKYPMSNGKETDWETLDKEVITKLQEISKSSGQIRILSNTILSPTTKKVIEKFKSKYPDTKHITYDPLSANGMLEANRRSFGKRVLPTYDFSKADVIVSVAADFLGTWISPIEFAKQYSKTRKLEGKKNTMSRHYQYESNFSLTGSNADYRVMIKPSEEVKVIKSLHTAVATLLGKSSRQDDNQFDYIDKLAKELVASSGKSLVVAGTNNEDAHVLVNSLNWMLGNYGNTINISRHANYKSGNDSEMSDFIDDLKNKKIKGVIFYDCNPIYNHPKGKEIASYLESIPFKLSTSDRADETAKNSDWVAPNHHYLESWDDAEPILGSYSVMQPTIRPIFNTRQAQDSFLRWSGESDNYYDFLRNDWRLNMSYKEEFDTFWNKVLYDGFFEVEINNANPLLFEADVNQAINNLTDESLSGVELALYAKVGIGDGTQANNPWLQEMPDPITKATWDNYLTVSPNWAKENVVSFTNGNTNMVNLTVDGVTVRLPILVQPGQAPNTIGLAYGYGRVSAGKVANNRGVNAFPFKDSKNVQVEVLEDEYQIAQTQTHQTYMGRETVIQEALLSDYQQNPSAGRYNPHVSTWMEESHKTNSGSLSLWEGHKYKNHHWGLAIDLNSCTGCSACHVACQAENNIPVVGKEEVLNRRDMHWIRIDRYYSSPKENDFSEDELKNLREDERLEMVAHNPEVTFQPMMCQHCNNAPCETVCPVAATTHSSEGLNQMTYNRCIGTRYCANNCPYKVRRFNWFKYHDNSQFENINTSMNNDLGKMVLNPDVTVRSRGVMEKCTMCVQRIQYGKLEAKKQKRKLKDGEIDVACASSCPSDAIVFGDMNDKESRIYNLLKINDIEKDDYITEKEIHEPRAYHVLEEIGVKPNVTYLTKIRNKA